MSTALAESETATSTQAATSPPTTGEVMTPTRGLDPLVVAQHQHELREHGFTVFRNIISPSLLAALRQSIDVHIANRIAEKCTEHYHGVNLIAWDPAFCTVASDPLLLATFEGLLGDDCILSSCNLGARIPGCTAQGLHRDTGIWGSSMPFMPFPVGIQTAWCIDDFTEDNGSTLLIAGSHCDPAPVGDRNGVKMTAPAGSIVAFDCQAFHAGGANSTTTIRRAALTLYIRSWIKPQTDHKRSFPTELIGQTSPVMLRLLGFRRQSPVEMPDGQSIIINAPGATYFYDRPPAGPVAY